MTLIDISLGFCCASKLALHQALLSFHTQQEVWRILPRLHDLQVEPPLENGHWNCNTSSEIDKKLLTQKVFTCFHVSPVQTLVVALLAWLDPWNQICSTCSVDSTWYPSVTAIRTTARIYWRIYGLTILYTNMRNLHRSPEVSAHFRRKPKDQCFTKDAKMRYHIHETTYFPTWKLKTVHVPCVWHGGTFVWHLITLRLGQECPDPITLGFHAEAGKKAV